MAFVKYITRNKKKLEGIFRINKSGVLFFLHNLAPNATYANVHFDEEKALIGIEFLTKKEEGSLKIQIRSKISDISIRTLCAQLNLLGKKIEAKYEYDKKDRFYVFCYDESKNGWKKSIAA